MLAEDRVRRVAFDIGGTFTDILVLWQSGRLQSAKVLSLLQSVGSDIRTALGIDDVGGCSIIHGTTVAANALLENKLARVGLITTKGFRDVLEMRSQRRPNIYDINWERTRPLIPRELRIEVGERILADGTVDTPLDTEEAVAAIEVLLAARVEAIAICLINSYVNPAHEQSIKAAIRQIDGKVPISVSSEKFAEMREYERTSTTAVNASLMPVIDAYLTDLERQLGVNGHQLQIMQSNGGLMNSRVARDLPVQMVESGPAAGVLAAARLAREVGLEQVLTFDMGGTTAKATLIKDGMPLEKPGGEVGGGANLAARFFGGVGHAIRVPVLDIAEVGAGGGSIAWIDHGGALRVGPEGAGADPGPACYGRGGQGATVTDANVVLGYINPTSLAGSTVKIDRDAAAVAITEKIAKPLGFSLYQAARGILEVANVTTMRALRAVSIERGIDPRNVAMVAFGGCGPVHAAELATTLGIGKVYVPAFPGIFSALGLMQADFRYDVVRGKVITLAALDRASLLGEYVELEEQARQALVDQRSNAIGIELRRFLDVQYVQQDSPLTVALPVDATDLAAAITVSFREAHRAAFGYARDDAAEIVSVRVHATAPGDTSTIENLAGVVAPVSTRAKPMRRPAYFPDRGMVDIDVIERSALDSVPRSGPLVVEEWDTSVVVPPDWSAARDTLGNIVMTKTAGNRA